MAILLDRLIRSLVLLVALAAAAETTTGQQLNNEQAFILIMKVYNLTPSSPTNVGREFSPRCGTTYLAYYVTNFDYANYTRARNDEFERPQYAQRMQTRMNDRIQSATFETTYTTSIQGIFGEYDASVGGFPFRFAQSMANGFSLMRLMHGDGYCTLQSYAVPENLS